MAHRKLYHGPLIHSISPTVLQALPRALVAVNEAGVVEWVVDDLPHSDSLRGVAAQHGWDSDDPSLRLILPRHGEWLMPGFVDTHTHAPQFPNIASGGQYELLDWLTKVTFPREALFAQPAYARKTYAIVVDRIISLGTTTCCYYGTLHLEATKILANIVHERGQRAFVGKCNMDRNGSPTYEEASAGESLAQTADLVDYIHSLPQPSGLPHPELAQRALVTDPNNRPRLVQPIITPRFALACTNALLTSLGQLAASHNPPLAIQTHIAENSLEILRTKELFPECHSYAHVYDTHGLLGPKTILAHGCLLDDQELELIKERGAGISHCPTSNFNLRSGIANVGKMLDKGIKVGLGTDVSGGFAPSILAAIRDASTASKIVSFQKNTADIARTASISTPPELIAPLPIAPLPPADFSESHLSLATLFHLATLGGASLCSLQDTIGNFLPGKAFDALLVSLRPGTGNPCVWWEEADMAKAVTTDELQSMLETFFFAGDDRNIISVWVQGRLIGGTEKGD